MADFEKQWLFQKCPRCDGDGVLILSGLLNGEEIIGDTLPCPLCEGKGEIKWGFLKVPITP